MKKLFRITKAIIGKIVTLILLSVLTLFNIALKIFTPIFRWLTIPVIILGLIIVGATYFDNGYSPSLLYASGLFIVMTALYFMLPLIPPVIFQTQLRMKDYLLAPIFIRSRMKFTL